MVDLEATIDLNQEISYSVVATFKDSGKPIPGAVVTDLEWISTQPIGNFVPTNDPNTVNFVPSKAGITQISAKAKIGGIIIT